ncbi:MAG: DUF2796 domain-containing protein [Rhizobacter sp.]|nr:DUF2796 domain-containing protein [Rhizobacter sp.]
MKRISAWVAALFLSSGTVVLAQGQPHVHGVARLDVAVEAGQVVLQFETPLDSLLGFERAPRGADETRRAELAIAALKAADALFRFTPAAGCTPARVDLRSAALKLGSPDPAEAHEGHADLDATYVFKCVDSAKAAEVDVGLFEAFSRLQGLKVEVVTARGQFKRDLKRPAKRVSLAR